MLARAGRYRAGVSQAPGGTASDAWANDAEGCARMFAEFARSASPRAPLYTRLAAGIAASNDLAGLLLLSPPRQRQPVLLLACVPIAMFANFIRVTVTCLLHIYVGQEYATGTYHMALGMVTLLLAFGIFTGLAWLLNNLMVEVADDEPAGAAREGA